MEEFIIYETPDYTEQLNNIIHNQEVLYNLIFDGIQNLNIWINAAFIFTILAVVIISLWWFFKQFLRG